MRTLSFVCLFLCSSLLLLLACSPEDNTPDLSQQSVSPQSTIVEEPSSTQADTQQARAQSEIREARTQPETVAEADKPSRQNQATIGQLHDGTGAYTIQVAAHRNEHMANNSAQLWKGLGYSNTYIHHIDNPEDPWFKVFLGRYSSFSNAEQAAKQLNSGHNESSWPLRFPL